jgi:hypothetical protein
VFTFTVRAVSLALANIILPDTKSASGGNDYLKDQRKARSRRHGRMTKGNPDHERALTPELDHEAVLMDVDALAKGASSAPAPKSGEYMKKAWERIDHYWDMMEKAIVQLGWSDDQSNKQKVELLSRLAGRRDDAYITARFIYQAAIDYLKRKPEPLRQRAASGIGIHGSSQNILSRIVSPSVSPHLR